MQGPVIRECRVAWNKTSKGYAKVSTRSHRFPRSLAPVNRYSSSLVPSAPNPELPQPPSSSAANEESTEKPARRNVRSRTSKGLESKSGENVALPSELAESLIWLPEENLVRNESFLPPEEMMEEVLSNAFVCFQPKIQHRATYTTSAGPPIEPSMSLYCPIEGGTYVIDATVQELARRINAEVLIIDALDILAGEWGSFGKAAAALQLPSNPLQLGELHTSPSQQRAPEEDEDMEGPPNFGQVMEGMQLGGGRGPFIAIRRPSSASRNAQTTKKTFFQDLVGLQRTEDDASGSVAHQLRLIYVRDMSLLSDTLPHWYPQLVEAVRARRPGPISRPTAPVINPTVMVLGISPSIITPRTPPPSPEPGGLLSLLMSRNSPQSRNSPPPLPNPKGAEWDESPASQKAREKRLHDRLSKWEKHDASVFHPDLPDLSASADGSSGRLSVGKGLMNLFVAIPDSGSGPPTLSAPSGDDHSPRNDRASDHARLNVILPRARDPGQETATRIHRRLQINQINMRTAVGIIGGDLSKSDEIDSLEKSLDPSSDDTMRSMLLDWSNRIESWARTKAIADKAMGSFVAGKNVKPAGNGKLDLSSTPVPWTAIAQSWSLVRNSRLTRKNILSTFTTKPEKNQESVAAEEQTEEDQEEEEDDVEDLIETLKRDTTLDPHEQRLIGCIVNPNHMPTTFAQVHLPPATIDSIRTIVSLPLLHPLAFTHGILKQHSMTGALLFGAPGTGKTLSIRALARESGARMMIIKPSDVMDMYVGEGEKLVRAVFTLARRISPCVIFMDEIDALLGARFSSRGGGSDTAHRGVITEFMQEMDGLRTSKDANVIVIGATNRPFDLDDAVLRRLPRRLLIDLPGVEEREAILKILLADEQLHEDVNISALAKRTESFSGSDLKHLCVAAALDAVKEHAKLPWAVPGRENGAEDPSRTSGASIDDEVNSASPDQPRVLQSYHFEKALKEITPSASEQLGTLAELRKWNEEFGEGGRKRGKRMWGGKFGFLKPGDKIIEEGRVQNYTQ